MTQPPPPPEETPPAPSDAPAFCVGCGCKHPMELRRIVVNELEPYKSKTTLDMEATGPLAWQCGACGNVYMDEHIPVFVNYAGERFD